MKPGDKVAFSQSVTRRTGGDGKARGVIVDVIGKVARVDFGGTWLAHEDGGTVRTVPVANLTRVMSSGAIFGD